MPGMSTVPASSSSPPSSPALAAVASSGVGTFTLSATAPAPVPLAKLRRRQLLRGTLRACRPRFRSSHRVAQVMSLRVARSRPLIWRRAKRILSALAVSYVIALLLLIVWPRARAAMIYLHWLRPPAVIAPLDNLDVYRLSSCGRVIRAGHLRGWHLLPPGPPFAPAPVSGFEKGREDPQRDAFFDRALRGHNPSSATHSSQSPTRVVLFFHGNSGTRAFPFKRVDMLRQLNAHLGAHVVTFDYSGFGDSPGRPSEEQFNRDSIVMYDWVKQRTSSDADVILYGKSLGTFAAVHISATVCPRSNESVPVEIHPVDAGDHVVVAMEVSSEVRNSTGHSRREQQATDHDDKQSDSDAANSENVAASAKNRTKCDRLRAVILDSPPASVLDASMSHPSVSIFRRIPRIYYVARRVLRNMHNSVMHVPRIDVPLLILHGERDRIIPIEQGMRIHASAVAAGNDRAEFVSFPTAGHNNANSAPEFLLVLHRFLSKYLRPVKSCD